MHMTGVPQQKNREGDKHWLVMNELGERFGPVNFETLKLWAKDGRLAPTNTASEDEKVWTPVTQFADLEMDWVAEVSSGAFYGPIHKLALETLKKEGAIPADAITFQREPTDLPTSKTQSIPSPVSMLVPLKEEGAEVVLALERQLSLERQRSQDIMKQLQQVEIHVATSEARAEACEKAQKHYATQTEQAQQHLVTQLDQTNTQLSHIHAQLLAREQDLHRTEQRLASFERIETLVQECMAQMTRQQQELKATVTTTQESDSLSAERIETVLKDTLAQLASHQHELKASVVATQGTTSLVAPVEPTVRDALAQLATQQQELKATVVATQGQANLSAERVETILKDAMVQLASQQQELKATVLDTQGHANLVAEHGETVLKDATAQLATQQQELKAAVVATQGHANLVAERSEIVLKDAMAQLATQQQELKAAVLDTQGSATLSAERIETLVKETMAQLASPQQNQATEILIEKLSVQLTSAFKASQSQLVSDLSQTLKTEGAQICCEVNKNQAHQQELTLQQILLTLKQETPPLVALLTKQGLALQRLNEEFNAVGTKTVEAMVPAVATLLDKGHEETIQRLCAKLEDGREHLCERTQTALSQWHEQLMRATGESQRLAIEYIVRELTTLMNQAVQTGRETFLQTVQGGWRDIKQQTATLESHLKQLSDAQQRLTHELKATLEKQLATPPPPTVKRTYVEAEVVEVTPPERAHKKAKTSPEDSAPAPTQHDTHASRQNSNPSMADIEQQARRELERLGAQGMNIFKRKS